jgi:adenine-specific DNA-methyltransferase
MMEAEKTSALNELISLFEYNISQYKGKTYDEAKTRADFIDKFFSLLGWDIYNTQGHSEQYREVVREDKVTIKGKVKAPDYCFRIGSERKFFVEAKKPSIDIKHDIVPAFQLRRYAYTSKLPLSILTDFEEFAVYDTRIKPDKSDKASTGRIFYCTYKDYPGEIDFITDTFSKQAILKGSFDKYIQDNKRKKGTSEVDKEFLGGFFVCHLFSSLFVEWITFNNSLKNSPVVLVCIMGSFYPKLQTFARVLRNIFPDPCDFLFSQFLRTVRVEI